MTRYADELRDSEGENVLVSSVSAVCRPGVIVEGLREGCVLVRFEDGTTERVGWGRVELVDTEDVFLARQRQD